MVWEISPEELLIRYQDGERNFAGIKLTYSEFYTEIDLKGIVLRDINLRGAYFEEVSMVGVDLSGADLGGVFMKQCIGYKAIIRDANLCAANLVGSSFICANFQGTLMSYMNASRTTFRNTKMSISFEQAILARANFEGADISSTKICSGWNNLIWNTTMPDGTVVKGPQWGNGRYSA